MQEILHQTRPKFVENRTLLVQRRANTVEKCQVSKIASLEDTSRGKRLRKHIAFWTTHEITYYNSGASDSPQVNNYIADVYLSDPNFEYVYKID